jgi:type IV secretion system protein VirB9
VLFVKPKGELADTNLVVKTDRRTYNFWLAQVKKGEPETFQLTFSYPDDEAEARRVAAERKEREDAAKLAALTPKPDPVETVRQSFEAARAARSKNLRYSAQGASTITPVAAFDDGLFTYFTFNPGGDLPALFVVNNDNSEAIADFHVEDSQIVVHRLSPKFILRRGDDVACIWNDAFDPRGEPNPTRTISPNVERVIKPAR